MQKLIKKMSIFIVLVWLRHYLLTRSFDKLRINCAQDSIPLNIRAERDVPFDRLRVNNSTRASINSALAQDRLIPSTNLAALPASAALRRVNVC